MSQSAPASGWCPPVILGSIGIRPCCVNPFDPDLGRSAPRFREAIADFEMWRLAGRL